MWKHWNNIPKSYIVDVPVDLFLALQAQGQAYVTEMYDVMGQIRDGTMQAGADLQWDVRI